eukprot:gene12211-8402_t
MCRSGKEASSLLRCLPLSLSLTSRQRELISKPKQHPVSNKPKKKGGMDRLFRKQYLTREVGGEMRIHFPQTLEGVPSPYGLTVFLYRILGHLLVGRRHLLLSYGKQTSASVDDLFRSSVSMKGGRSMRCDRRRTGHQQQQQVSSTGPIEREREKGSLLLVSATGTMRYPMATKERREEEDSAAEKGTHTNAKKKTRRSTDGAELKQTCHLAAASCVVGNRTAVFPLRNSQKKKKKKNLIPEKGEKGRGRTTKKKSSCENDAPTRQIEDKHNL